MRCLVLALVVLLSGCSSLGDVPPRGVELTCHARTCPSLYEIEGLLAAFQGEVPEFDPYAALDVGWYPLNFVFLEGDGTESIGHTVIAEPVLVETTSERVFIHELMHVHFLRTTGDGDPTHEDGNGPWTEESNEIIRSIILINGL